MCCRYHIKLLLGRSGGKFSSIEFASCECRAGHGPFASCKDIGAVCYGLEDFSRRGIFSGVTCSTSDLQKWSAPPAKRKASEMDFHAPTFGKVFKGSSARSSFDPRPPQMQNTSVELQREKLYSVLVGCNIRSSIVDSLAPSPKLSRSQLSTAVFTVQQLVSFLRSSTMFKATSTLPPAGVIVAWCDIFLEKMVMSKQQCHALEFRTRGQRRNPMWIENRFGRLTASVFGDVARCKNAHSSLVLRLLNGNPISAPALCWGKDKEGEACEAYVKSKRQTGNVGLTVSSRGLVVSESGFLGASPDGFVFDPSQPAGNCLGLLEIKCPFSARDMTPVEACQTLPLFPCSWSEENGLMLKRTHKYFYQIQGGMAICGMPWCDFVIWTPQGICIERVKYDHEFWQTDLLPQLVKFYHDWMLPQIIYPLEKPVSYGDVRPVDLSNYCSTPSPELEYSSWSSSPMTLPVPPRVFAAVTPTTQAVVSAMPSTASRSLSAVMLTASPAASASCCKRSTYFELALHQCASWGHNFHHICTTDEFGKFCNCCLPLYE